MSKGPHQWKFKLFGDGKCEECGQKAYHVCKTHGEKLCSSHYRKQAVEWVNAGIREARA